MLIRKCSWLLLATVLFLHTALTFRTALASEIQPYTQDAFNAAQKNGAKILLQYHASWCPVCKKQKNALNELVQKKDLEKVQFYSANYDTEKELKKTYNVKGQSTLILFKGQKELARVQGETDRDKIEDFIQKTKN